jgi:hypothetical protein
MEAVCSFETLANFYGTTQLWGSETQHCWSVIVRHCDGVEQVEGGQHEARLCILHAYYISLGDEYTMCPVGFKSKRPTNFVSRFHPPETFSSTGTERDRINERWNELKSWRQLRTKNLKHEVQQYFKMLSYEVHWVVIPKYSYNST